MAKHRLGNAQRLLMAVGTAVVIAAVVGGLLYLIAEGPYWFKRTPGLEGDPDQARWLSQEIRGNRTAILTMIGGSLAAAGAFITYQNLRITRRGHQTDRFAKALELLADDKPAVRLGGIYALNAVAVESPREVQPVVNALRLHADSDDTVSGKSDRAAARDVVDKLDPLEASDELLEPVNWKDLAGILAALGVAASLWTAEFSEAPTEGDVIGLVGLAVFATVFAAWGIRRDRSKAELLKRELQRPLLGAAQAFVLKRPAGGWVVMDSVSEAAKIFESHVDAVTDARARLRPTGGELWLTPESGEEIALAETVARDWRRGS